MTNSVSSELRNAAEQINAQRSAWDGVGFMAIENLETGACGLVLVPKGTPRPNWSKELQDAGNAWREVQPVAPVEDASPGNEVQPVALLLEIGVFSLLLSAGALVEAGELRIARVNFNLFFQSFKYRASVAILTSFFRTDNPVYHGLQFCCRFCVNVI